MRISARWGNRMSDGSGPADGASEHATLNTSNLSDKNGSGHG